MCMHECCHFCVRTTCVAGAHEAWMRTLDPLDLELETVLSTMGELNSGPLQ